MLSLTSIFSTHSKSPLRFQNDYHLGETVDKTVAICGSDYSSSDDSDDEEKVQELMDDEQEGSRGNSGQNPPKDPWRCQNCSFVNHPMRGDCDKCLREIL